MAGYTCVQCLQVLRQGVRAPAPQARLQSLATARRRSPISPSFIRSFGSQRNGRSLGNTPEQPKHTHNQTCCAPKSSPSPLTQRAAHTATGYSVNPRAVLKPDNLFHSFSNSPSPAIRKRAEFIKQNAFCPHPSHQQTPPPHPPTTPGRPPPRTTPKPEKPPMIQTCPRPIRTSSAPIAVCQSTAPRVIGWMTSRPTSRSVTLCAR